MADTMHSDDRDQALIIGRDELDDIEAILAITNEDDDAVERSVPSGGDTTFTWQYELTRPHLVKLYEKAKTSQWNVTTDIDWSIEVDQQKVAEENAAMNPRAFLFRETANDRHSPFFGWTEQQFTDLGVEMQNWTLSQFLHGEQGALVCTAKIVEQVPWIDAKYYASTQVMDEARHVEVFSKYLNEKLSGTYPINAHLGMLLDDIIADSRWDMTYLGMQIMVEGLALAAFGFMQMMTQEPLLKKILRYVMADEARHVAFGVLSLKEIYQDMSTAELKDRQEFAFEAAVRMRDRFLQQEVWARLGIDNRELLRYFMSQPKQDDDFTPMLFSKIVPNLKKLGLLDAGDGWLRQKFTELNAIQFEDWVDTGSEYELLDAVAADRAESA